MTPFSIFHFPFSITADSAGGIAALGVDVKALVLQCITFVIVFLLLKRFAFGKIMQALETRRQIIDQGVKLGQELAAEKEKLAAQTEAVLQKARVEADRIIAAGHEQTGDLLKEAERAATRKTEVMLSDAEVRIREEIDKARKALERQMLELVADATGKIIEVKLDAQRDAALLRKALHEVERS